MSYKKNSFVLLGIFVLVNTIFIFFPDGLFPHNIMLLVFNLISTALIVAFVSYPGILLFRSDPRSVQALGVSYLLLGMFITRGLWFQFYVTFYPSFPEVVYLVLFFLADISGPLSIIIFFISTASLLRKSSYSLKILVPFLVAQILLLILLNYNFSFNISVVSILTVILLFLASLFTLIYCLDRIIAGQTVLVDDTKSEDDLTYPKLDTENN